MEKLNCLSCQIFIGNGYLNASLFSSKDCFLITDDQVYGHHKVLIDSLSVPFLVVAAGEASKTREKKSEIEDFLLSHNCHKKSTLIGLGGGMVSDLVGFTASTFMRGIDLILVPTSLLAMADSTIGGKNAVDTPHGKNLIGCIYRPSVVYIDIQFLKSLPRKMWAAGMGEIIKIAAMRDLELFDKIRDRSLGEVVKDFEFVKIMVRRAVELKADVVEKDEFESGLRMILNFGHTVGHAVEAELGDMNHGLCVGIGMYTEVEMASFLSATEIDPEEFKETLTQYELPWRIPDIPPKLLLARAKLDKKRRTAQIPIFVPQKIGFIKPEPINVSEDDFLLLCSNTVRVASGPQNFDDVIIPGSKSLTNRYILLAAMCKGTTLIKDALVSEDTLVMIDCLTKLGLCTIKRTGHEIEVTGQEIPTRNAELYVSNAGTVARFLAMTCLLVKGNTIMKGSQRMHQRPIKDLIDAINFTSQRGKYLENQGTLPIEIEGGGFDGGEININCSISSQYVSSILLAAPLGKKDTTLNLTEKSEPTSFSYIKMTVLAMQQFGANVQMVSPVKYIIKNTGYTSPGTVRVEPDAGSASYFFALATLHRKTIEIKGLGVNSTQGELQFVRVLEKMGCSVDIFENSTRVTGNSLSPVKVDMDECTDSFITAAVVMATCDGSSEISGIANQRVKECNRILAVVTELRKLGVHCDETDDGLIIHGRSSLSGNAQISTYNDHRIAMAFSLLSSILPSVQIKHKQVVSKTFPNYWKCLKGAGCELRPDGLENPAKNIVLVGMRGVGKTTQGRILAQNLHWFFKDIDKLVQSRLNITDLSAWVTEHGVEKFRQLEYEELLKCIKDENTVIVCGGGIIEFPRSISVLYNHYPVVWLRTKFENIEENLKHPSVHRIPINLTEAYKRRKILFKKVADFQFYSKTKTYKNVGENFLIFTNKILGQQSPLPPNFSAFGCVTEKTDLSLLAESQFLTGIEVRADSYTKILKAYKDLTCLKEVIFGVQTIFTHRADVNKAYWKVLKHSLQFLPDFIDIQYEQGADWYIQYLKFKKNLKTTRVVLSYHSEDPKDVELIYNQMHSLKPDILKFIAPFKPIHPSSNPEIVFSLGTQNTITRVLNTYFSPVRVDAPMAKGQLSYNELKSFQEQFYIRPANLKFYLAGNNISRSPAARLYNSLFTFYGLEYALEFLETNDINSVVNTLKDNSCMGMLITIPFKLQIIPFLDSITEEAVAIGSVNTVIKYKNKLIGHNTDWCGLYYPIKYSKIDLSNVKATVLGAGGTSKAALYALEKLGVKNVTLWNRSENRIAESKWSCKTTTDLESVQDSGLFISTVPGNSEIKLEKLNKETLVVEAAYFPDPTFIGQQALDSGSKLITGKDMYLYMALFQFPLLTGRSIVPELIQKYLSFN